ncbi:hypothetical protein BT63DRAFT_398595 [Microthyrium microscopicum]|uniref:Uncharacterized protein n=1 Tax=Microthyrium microscopicum TaxID=703497 RepID=A0A6A6UMK2_9PEZI|nr:hypothetical protein BT63DRAFT_398595 [Microthyrium microscopicum]
MCLSRKPSISSLFNLLICLPFSFASPLPQPDGNGQSPCAQIPAALTPNPSLPTSKGLVPAQLAWDCLHSIPINSTGALDLVESIKPYMSFQTTVAFLKDPPAEYAQKLFGSVDLVGGLDNIASKVRSGEYKGEYEFALELYTLLQSAHEGHLYFAPEIVREFFSWTRGVALVSVSEDGTEVPDIFVYSDVLAAAKDSSFEPSAVDEIDNYAVEEYLLKLSTIGSLQDRDALFNTLFYSLPQIALGPNGLGAGVFSGAGRGSVVYPEPSTTIKFENGTVLTFSNQANVKKDFAGLTSGQAVYDKFIRQNVDMKVDLEAIPAEFNVETDPRFPQTPAVAKDDTAIPAPGYPTPVARMKSNELGGFFLDGPGYEDIAVLSIPSFIGDSGQQEFQDVARTFLSKAKAAGKKKLVIDVSANGGGTIWLGYEIFAQLFPSIEPFGGQRFRAHQTWDEMGKLVSKLVSNTTRTGNYSANVDDWISSPMNYRSDFNIDNKPFNSWEEKYGPHAVHGDSFTTTQRWNLNDPLGNEYSGLASMTKYGPNPLPSLDLPFTAEDMVLVYDGYCASTCTIFSELMRQQGKVETIAMGGRLNKDIIQAVGGTKGTNDWSWLGIMEYVMNFYQAADASLKTSWRGTEMSTFNSFLPYHRMNGGPVLNMRDGLRQGDDSGTPLQFIVEPADCRLYYTAEMTMDITAMWKAAADAKFFGKRDCVAGGFKNGNGQAKKKLGKAPSESATDKKAPTVSVPQLAASHIAGLEKSLNVAHDSVLDRRAAGLAIP